MIRMYTVEELEDMETLSEGHSQDFKIEERGFRVALTRTLLIDQEVEYEVCVGGKWYDAEPDEDEGGEFFTVKIYT